MITFQRVKANKMRHIKSNAKTPFDKQVIYWIVDNSSGSTICEAWKTQHEIECLEKAGYKIINVESE
jgi:hypothetical protein